LAVNDDTTSGYESSALAVATAAIAQRASWLPASCTSVGTLDKTCVQAIVKEQGEHLWRRPWTATESSRYVALYDKLEQSFQDQEMALTYMLAGILQSPHFLYQVEIGEVDPEHAGERRLTLFELATRMSYFLLDAPPDPALLADARTGELGKPEKLRSWAQAMLKDPRSKSAVSAWFSEMFTLEKLDTLSKDKGTYPGYSSSLAQSMKEETLALVRHVVWEQNSDFREILDANYTFLNPELAKHYGITYPTSGNGGWVKVNLPASQKRAGVLGHAAFLSMYAHPAGTSPTLRGKFVREHLLCQSIPAPPNDVSTELPPSSSKAPTMRERLSQHMQEPRCAGCHRLMDPIGFGLEIFDGVGQFRTQENNTTIDAKTTLDDLGDFEGADGLGTLLRNQPAFSSCVVKNLVRHAWAHVESKSELPAIYDLNKRFEASSYKFQDLLVEVVTHESFRRLANAPSTEK
jgi:hypothetical protein